MPQVKGAMMKAPGDVRVATTAGYTINFKANEEKFVPALAVRECLKYGAKETKRFTNTATNIPGEGTKGSIKSQVQTSARQDDHLVEETSLAPDVEATSDAEATRAAEQERRNDVVFDEADTHVRNGIIQIIEDADQSDWTGGKPKVQALARAVPTMSVTATVRDRVWEKMERAGDIPDNLDERLGL